MYTMYGQVYYCIIRIQHSQLTTSFQCYTSYSRPPFPHTSFFSLLETVENVARELPTVIQIPTPDLIQLRRNTCADNIFKYNNIPSNNMAVIVVHGIRLVYTQSQTRSAHGPGDNVLTEILMSLRTRSCPDRVFANRPASSTTTPVNNR